MATAGLSHIGNFEVIMLGAIGLALYRGVRLPLFRTFMVLGCCI